MHKKKIEWKYKKQSSLSMNKVNVKSNVQKMLTALKDTLLSLVNE